MGFSGIGIWEIMVILVVILLVLGPNRLPEMARKMGQAIRAIRKASAELTTTLSREVEGDEKKPQPPKPTPPKPGLTENIPPPDATAAKKPPAARKTPAARKPRAATKKPRTAAKKPPQAPGEAPGKP